MSLAILGPDGSGKSRLMNEISANFGWRFKGIETYHWRPAVLPDIGVLFRRRKPSKDAVVSKPHSSRPHGKFLSLLRLLYYVVDFNLGWILKVRPAVAGNRLVVFDRYAGDMYADPLRYRMDLPDFILRGICNLVPPPDLTLILVAPAPVLLSRKNEISLEAIEAILLRLKRWSRGDPDRNHILDAAQPAEDVALAAINLLARHMSGQ